MMIYSTYTWDLVQALFFEVNNMREISCGGELSVEIESICKKHFEDMIFLLSYTTSRFF